MMETATNAVVDGKMEPMDKSEVAKQDFVKGQYLYDLFIDRDTDSQITKMDFVRESIDKTDAFEIAGACNKMVEIAKEHDKAAGFPEKDEKTGKALRGPKTQTAMNTRTVIQQAWGALKFARPQLEKFGYTDKTGYQDMRVLAKKALDEAKKDWKGGNALSDADKERKAMLKKQKGIQDVISEVTKENPMNVGESFLEYQVRIAGIAEDRAEEVRKENDQKVVTETADKLEKTLDDNQRYMLAVEILDRMGIEFHQEVEIAPTEEQTGETTGTDERAETTSQEPAHV